MRHPFELDPIAGPQPSVHTPRHASPPAAAVAAATLLAAALIALAPAPRPLGAQVVAERGALAGVVRDQSGNGLAAAQISVVDGEGQRAVSDDEGNFVLTRLPLGPVTLSVRRLGYRPRDLTAYVGRARAARVVTIVLDQLPQRIAAVEVRSKGHRHSGPTAGFYERLESRANGGTFFTREQIDSMRPHRTTDILRRVPGFSFTSAVSGAGLGAERKVRSRDRRCSPLVWIDGTPATTSYYDPDLVNPRTIEGIEVYAGVATVPSVLMGPAGASSCGAIAIWTREGQGSARDEDREQRQEAAATLAALVDSVQVYTEAEVDRAAELAPAARFAPVYPVELRRSNITGVVVTEFVVDVAGKVEPATFGVVYSPDPLFTEAVNAALAEARFTPAMRAGNPVRQLVQLPVHFANPQSK